MTVQYGVHYPETAYPPGGADSQHLSRESAVAAVERAQLMWPMRGAYLIVRDKPSGRWRRA